MWLVGIEVQDDCRLHDACATVDMDESACGECGACRGLQRLVRDNGSGTRRQLGKDSCG